MSGRNLFSRRCCVPMLQLAIAAANVNRAAAVSARGIFGDANPREHRRAAAASG